jgi:hypothetical protein
MARLISYEDLALAIEADRGGGYRVNTLNSPYGLASAPFSFPFSHGDVKAMVHEFEGVLLRSLDAGSAPVARHMAVEEPGPARGAEWSPRETGARLFQALFQGAVRDAYLLSRGRTETLPDHGLRVRIVLPADTEDAGLLHALPWELLYCEQTNDFLARNVLTPVVRQLAISGVSSAFREIDSRIRILIVAASPRGVPALDEATERARILEAWCRQTKAEVKLLPRATLSDLYAALRSDRYHVVHFIGHGNFDIDAGVGSLVMETAEHEPHFVPSSVLADTLRASRELRLVFLNSCESAQVGPRRGQDPLLGMAAALVRRGVPAVIAMQFSISDVAAKTFSEAVYRSLVRGSSLEAAVADGRLALYQEKPESWEWMTPTLFTTLSEASVFLPLCSAAEDRTTIQEEAVARSATLLSSKSYDRARQAIESCLDQGADQADLHYYLALALLRDRRPRFLSVEQFRPIEASARRVLDLADCAAHHLCFLAFLQRDFYLENYLLPPEPSDEDLLQRAAAVPSDPARLAELVRLVPWAGAVVDLVAEQVKSEVR